MILQPNPKKVAPLCDAAMKLKENTEPLEAHIDLTPMIDTVMFLLIFFMVVTNFSLQEADISFALPGVAALTVPQRATIANMGAELGVTTSIFPSDERTRAFLAAQSRPAAYQPLAADDHARIDVVELPQRHPAHQGHAVFQACSAPDADMRADHAEGAHIDFVVDFRILRR
jgi:homoaconitase/3-isopropylmalate dehydratase large subunit